MKHCAASASFNKSPPPPPPPPAREFSILQRPDMCGQWTPLELSTSSIWDQVFLAKMQNFRSQHDDAWEEDSRPSSGGLRRKTTFSERINVSTKQNRTSTRQWGEYALWVGNIPSNTTVMSLRDYFAEAAPAELLTISYNPDAKYAFVNFSTEAARIAAIGKAASQLFDGRRLDCRIRRDKASRSTKVSYGLNSSDRQRRLSISPERPASMWNKVEELKQHPETDASQRGRDKYFILKSYSLEALYQSLATNVWHIPKRHVERLNHAFQFCVSHTDDRVSLFAFFQTGSKVYFLFSVNGSGEFFGYASMTAEIRQDEMSVTTPGASHRPSSDASTESLPIHMRSYGADAQPTEFRHRALSTTSSDASYGSIHYEPERRRIIWEASHHTSDHQSVTPEDFSPDTMTPVTPSESSGRSFRDFPNTANFEYASSPSMSMALPPQAAAHPTGSELQHLSEPCRIKWHSTVNLPFDEVRGLRNPWNENKEVHVARNVTAVEPDAAESLLERWKRKDEARRFQHSQDAISKAWPGR
ncbi:hypothetical protein PV08_03127 [Exophiala spinifera]|uniref:RRM domain-containing protein n=1 Tax=Exophiala spinifera TaxID=91928 RepID=A0A0D2BIT1_9EURO|nr:uncharacterized protein PV08_03127 [Exophiala spinifera]KIW18838.1 hypothetical protein PV08_03127 [Exophiala spinifera]